jgi:hypothetical protein
MIHSLADYSSDKKNNPIKSISKPINSNSKKIQAHKSVGKYPMPKNNNINNNSKAFKGRGKAVSMVKTDGLKINKYVQNKTNKNKEIIKINIRLFNGNVVSTNFNSDQTLRDIKNFVEKKTESHNFSLVEGFPPKVLNNFTATIEQLNLKNCLITQKLK